MLCGLRVPSLRSLWGAVRNRRLYILRMYCKGCISFNFSIFFIIYTTYRKKKITRLTAKMKKFIFFYNSHDLQQNKIYTHLQQKKNRPFFLYTTYIFHLGSSAAAKCTTMGRRGGGWGRLGGVLSLFCSCTMYHSRVAFPCLFVFVLPITLAVTIPTPPPHPPCPANTSVRMVILRT